MTPVLWIIAGVAVAGAVIGIWAVTKMLAVNEASMIGPVLDLLPSQKISFDAPGAYVLYAQPMLFLKSVVARANIGLWDAASNAYLLWNSPPRQRRDLMATRVAQIVFHVPRAGEYQLVIGNVDFAKAPFEERLIFGRYVADKVLIFIALTVAGFLATLFGIIIIAIAVTSR